MRYTRALLFLILVVAAGLRCASLPDRSWWIDELITRDVARLPFYKAGFWQAPKMSGHSVLSFAAHDKGCGPLTYAFDGALARWADPMGREYWLRVPGIVAGLLTIIALWRGRRRMFGGTAGGLTAAALAGAMPYMVDWSTGARGYGWAVPIGIGQYWCAAVLCANTPRRNWIVALLVGLSFCGMMVHPVHILWTATVFGALVITLLRCRIRGVFLPVVSGGVVLAGISLCWLVPWYGQTFKPDAGGVGFSGIPQKLIRAFIEDSALTLTILFAVLAGIVLAVRSHKPARTLLVVCCLLTLAASAALAVFLTRSFYIAPRYFYSLVACCILLAAQLAQTGYARLRACHGRRKAEVFKIALVAAIVVGFAVPAYRAASTPIQNWKDAVVWLQARTQPDDVVLAGPNSEHAVLVTYARAARVAARFPVMTLGPGGTQVSLQEENGLQIALASTATLWFVTAYDGVYRTPNFWNLIHTQFTEAARFPGRMEVKIYVRKKGG